MLIDEPSVGVIPVSFTPAVPKPLTNAAPFAASFETFTVVSKYATNIVSSSLITRDGNVTAAVTSYKPAVAIAVTASGLNVVSNCNCVSAPDNSSL